MHYLLSVIHGSPDDASHEEMTAIMAFNQSLRENGHFVFANALREPADAEIIDNRADAGIQTPGPLFTGPEWYSGFWIIQTDTDDHALELAKEASRCCNRKVELRPFRG